MRRKIDSSKMVHLTPLKLTFSLEEVEHLLHGVEMVKHFRDADLLKPCIERHRMVLFRRKDVQECMEALHEGNLPPTLKSRPKDSEMESLTPAPDLARAA